MSGLDAIALVTMVALAFLVAWSVVGAVAAHSPRLGLRVLWLLPPEVRARVHYALGDVERALQALGTPSGRNGLLEVDTWNFRVCLLIAAGRYREAVGAGPGHLSCAEMRMQHPDFYAVVVINQVEALYNLGQWRRAERLMLALADSGLCTAPIALAGGSVQLAWILASTDRADEACWLLQPVSSGWLPNDYVAELHFTRALGAMKALNFAEAAAHLDEADARVRRASSRRNAMFLRARLWAAMGRSDEAIVLCKAASLAEYRGQGGDGLLLWGDLLAEKGRHDEARAAWQLAVDRDSQSESARTARTRLAGATR